VPQYDRDCCILQLYCGTSSFEFFFSKLLTSIFVCDQLIGTKKIVLTLTLSDTYGSLSKSPVEGLSFGFLVNILKNNKKQTLADAKDGISDDDFGVITF
jgi:hypothetical protein